MDVTCERCSTEYEFDDALVSETGTSVRCTQCGHRFKVKKQSVGAGAPDVWIVRTVGGDAMEFRALRDLKAAISMGRVGRDDVLSRGAGRSRRLASIAELEPFFVVNGQANRTNIGLGAIEAKSASRPRAPTPAGLGPVSSSPPDAVTMVTDHSVAMAMPRRDGRPSNPVNVPPPSTAFPLDAGSVMFAEDEVTERRQSTKELASLITAAADKAPVSVEPATLMERERFPSEGRSKTIVGGAAAPSAPTPAVTPKTPRKNSPAPDLGKSTKSSGSPFGSGSHYVNEARARGFLPSTEEDPESVTKTIAVGTPRDADAAVAVALPPPPAAPTALKYGSAEVELPGFESSDERPADAVGDDAQTRPASNAWVPPAPTAPRLPPPAPPPPATPPPPPAALPVVTPPPPPAVTPAPAAGVADASGDSAEEDKPSSEDPDRPAESSGSGPSKIPKARKSGRGRSTKPRVSLMTPTPGESRYSMMHDEVVDVQPSERQTSLLSSRRSSGSMRLIVGLLIGGIVVFFGVLVVQRYVKNKTVASTTADPRVAEMVEAGEKALRDGDIDGARERFIEARRMDPKDPRTAKAMAHLSLVAAELPWLELLLLPPNDAGRAAVTRRYNELATTADQAVNTAELAGGDDPEVVLTRIDALRLLGRVAEARKLVEKVASIASQHETMLVMAALDLSEQQRPSASVIDRLSQCAAQEGGAARARALLIYALGRSGDFQQARAELVRLEKLPKTHPLEAALKRFVERAEKGEDVALRVDDLPTVAPSTSASASASAEASAATNTLTAAQEALARNDLTSAERLYEKVLANEPDNVPALMGRASVAQRQGQAQLAINYYDKAVKAAPTNAQALASLADLKWSSGDQEGAKALYRRALDAGLAGSSANRARERLSNATASADPTSTQTTPAPSSEPTTTAPTTTTTTTAPTATATSTSEIPKWGGDE